MEIGRKKDWLALFFCFFFFWYSFWYCAGAGAISVVVIEYRLNTIGTKRNETCSNWNWLNSTMPTLPYNEERGTMQAFNSLTQNGKVGLDGTVSGVHRTYIATYTHTHTHSILAWVFYDVREVNMEKKNMIAFCLFDEFAKDLRLGVLASISNVPHNGMDFLFTFNKRHFYYSENM